MAQSDPDENLPRIRFTTDAVIDDPLNRPSVFLDQIAEALTKEPDLIYGHPPNA